MPSLLPSFRSHLAGNRLVNKVLIGPFQVRYTAFRDRPLQERQGKFINSLREGHTEIVSHPTFLLQVSEMFSCFFFPSFFRHL